MLQSLARLELRDGALIGKLAVALQAATLADVHPTAVACTANALARLGAAHRRLRELAQHEDQLVREVHGHMRAGQSLWSVPRMAEEVHDLQGLSGVGAALFGSKAG